MRKKTLIYVTDENDIQHIEQYMKDNKEVDTVVIATVEKSRLACEKRSIKYKSYEEVRFTENRHGYYKLAQKISYKIVTNYSLLETTSIDNQYRITVS